MNPSKKSGHPIVWTPEKVKQFWDYEARTPENYFTYQVGHALVKRLQRFIPRGSRVLDYGCGPGDVFPYLLECGFSVVGADYSDDSITAVKRAYAGKPGFEGAYLVEQLLKTGRRFDTVLLVEVLEHLDDEMLANTVTAVRQLLERGGRLLITVPNSENLSAQTLRCPECGVLYHRYQHVRSWSEESLTEFLTASRFSVSECFATDFSHSWEKNRVRYVVDLTLRLLRRRPQLPNLVCVATSL